MENATPMLRQYLDIKKLYPGTLLFFRLGDFYELFNEDAITGSRELEITLTARQKESKNPIPMCGVPYHAAAGYISRLVKKGYRVAICEQTESPSKGVKLVKREVVRVITPGTAVDPQLSDPKLPVYLASICESSDGFGSAFLDLASGDLEAVCFTGLEALEKTLETVERYGPAEVLCTEIVARRLRPAGSRSAPLLADPEEFSYSSYTVTVRDPDWFDISRAEQDLKKHFNIQDLTVFGIVDKPNVISAAASLLRYVKETQRSLASHITRVKLISSAEFLVLDAVTIRNLDIVDIKGFDGRRTLFGVIDLCVTSMGSRLLRSWLLRPSVKRSEIMTRQTAVAELTEPMLRDKLRLLLKGVIDLERLVGRLNVGQINPREVQSLQNSLDKAPLVNSALSDASSLLLQVLSENIFELPELRDLIGAAIVDEPPVNTNEGGVIRAGYSGELDELREVSASGKQTIAAFEENERARSGISNLKVRFNNVFGYFIEVSKGNLGRVPADYERKQTLANAERFTTPQLKEWEKKVLGAEARIAELENELFSSVLYRIRDETRNIQSTARAFATLDALLSLAEVATKRNYVRPVLHDGDEIEIKNGRHPVVEIREGDSFIPNDAYLNNSTDRLLVITGANMGGKSTVLRQIGLIQILAQIGSFVPATSARLPLVDRIWTRVGASDDVASGRSTFMVEMTETATILHNATPRSLILLDEIGRGTSTFDGMSIAWAVAEFLHDSPEHSAKTLFATHYHELTELAEHLPGAKNYQMAATERDGDVVFLHRLQKGKASKSYGIAVARLAGLPTKVIERAGEVLRRLERYELAVFSDEAKSVAAGHADDAVVARAVTAKMAAQFSLFDLPAEEVINELRALDLSTLSPDDARRVLEEFQTKVN
jgi:DNA mismatch repair protein MutS